jgi:hypothetical protein
METKMKQRTRTILSVLFLCLLVSVAFSQPKELKYNPAEVESMLFLFNKTTIKGSDVEIMAPLQEKLKSALEKAREAKAEDAMITLELSVQELQICHQILNNAEFEAKYAELVLGMKNKIKELLPAQPMMQE